MTCPTIVFTYNLDPNGPLVVASTTKSFNVTEGSNTLNFVTADYDTASFDEDGDGISNLVELDEFSTTSPVGALCKLGFANIDFCEF